MYCLADLFRVFGVVLYFLIDLAHRPFQALNAEKHVGCLVGEYLAFIQIPVGEPSPGTGQSNQTDQPGRFFFALL